MQSHHNKRSISVATGDQASFRRRKSPRTSLDSRELTPTLSVLSSSFNRLDANIELLEGGGAWEGLTEECVVPTSHVRKWSKCFVVRSENKLSFQMFIEGSNRHIISARREGDEFFFTRYDNRASTGSMGSNSVDREGICAVLRLRKASRKFELFSKTCELCDGVLARFSCGPQSPSNGDRQLLAEIVHSTANVKKSESQCRRIAVELPFVHSDKSRVVWCPRSGTPTQAARRSSLESLGATSDSPVRVRRSTSVSQPMIRELVREKSASSALASSPSANPLASSASSSSKKRAVSEGEAPRKPKSPAAVAASPAGFRFDAAESSAPKGPWQKDENRHRLILMSKLPRWNEKVGSFCMNFHGNRIQMASSKNFVFECNQILGDDPGRSVLQFGKVRKEGDEMRFSLDFRTPVAPIQAFAILLSACAWCGPKI